MDILKHLVQKWDDDLFQRVSAVKEKYEEIWKYYRENMPECVTACKSKFGENIDGPQGIYWIGRKPLIFIAGRENFSWIDDHDFNDETTMALPLWFCFFQTAYMQGFWAKTYWLIKNVLGKNEFQWFECLDFVALSNACKCYDPSHQWNLHAECSKRGFIDKEIEVVNAPINIFFTKTFGTLANNSEYKFIHEINGSGIFKYVRNNRIFYEMNHPGRMSYDTLKVLIEDVRKELFEKKLL